MGRQEQEAITQVNEPIKWIATEPERVLQPEAKRNLGIGVMSPDRVQCQKGGDRNV